MTHYLANYAYFTNKFDLDRAASLHRAEHWQAMNKTDRAVLDMIRQYSVKYGAAHLKHDTIAEQLGKSNVTVRRAIRKLVALEIVEKTHFVRPVMNGLGANIYAIKPFETPEKKEVVEKPVKADVRAHAEEVSAGTTVADKKPEEVNPPLHAEKVVEATTYFGRMKAFLASTIGDDKLTRNFFGVYRQLTIPMLKFSIHADKEPLFETLGIQAMQISTQASKRKKIHNLPGYFSGVLRELINEALFSDAFMDYTTPPPGIFK